ncbi:hypothetical protein [Jiella sonneratiae]|uniref:Uncharacterized protein n=1 Tax=Jiella sonneratiae TaxID=2816856 RepID=A0ABS3J4G0_9HYPH|nr:hypothetical protein [Jiella sonneratiae]MBO0904566.1 hypothetical protein [Jiella sonneratiae]
MTRIFNRRLALAALALFVPFAVAGAGAGSAQTATGPAVSGGQAVTPGSAAVPGAGAGAQKFTGTMSGGNAGATAVPVGPDMAPSSTRADYPTPTIADYVFACMATNGNTQTALNQCSCSFDVVASLIPYSRYVEASTWLSMRQVSGENGSLFRSAAEGKAAIDDLRRAQAEAEIRCFE